MDSVSYNLQIPLDLTLWGAQRCTFDIQRLFIVYQDICKYQAKVAKVQLFHIIQLGSADRSA